MPNKEGHRRFGNVRKLPSGRYQVRYPGPDGRLRSHPQTFDRKGDAERALSLIEAQIIAGEWTDPQRGKARLGDYARDWITQRPGLRIRTVDFYRWLLTKHIDPYLGDVPIGKLTTQIIREWRSGLVARGVSATTTAKAYRLLRAVLMTAVEEDKILPRNPCRIRGAGSEQALERPVLTVAQVFDLAELVGRRPVGNIRQLAGGGYRLRFQRNGEMRTAPEVYRTRVDAEQTLWAMTLDGRADCNHDRRYRALVLLATFASLRWGEATALRRCDIDLDAGTVRVRAAYAERSTGELMLGPPKSKAGRRIVGIPRVIIPELRKHLRCSSSPIPARSPSPGPRAARCVAATSTAPQPGRRPSPAIGAAGLHFHDLRHTGNTFAAASGAGLRDLMARMGHDSERAAIIYQHEARGADTAITNAIDAHVGTQRARDDGNDDGLPGALIPAG